MVDHAIYSEEAGCFVNSKIQRLAELLFQYDQGFELRWVPPRHRSDMQKSRPYCIVHVQDNKPPYVVMYFSELDPPEEILAKIFDNDNKNGDAIARMDARNAAAEAFKLKEQLDQRMEAADMFHFLATNRSKNVVRWRDPATGEMVKLDERRKRMK